MDKIFDFKRAEAELNAKWLNGNMFSTMVDHSKKPFTIIMPPPNVTSKLHLGHAFENTLIDTLIRFKRMQGFKALFIPGADHAAIATEVKVVEELRKQGIEKSDLTREEFLGHVHKWYDIYIEEIKTQLKSLGISADWSRFRFTMDDMTTKAVKHSFDHLNKKGFVYQGERMINACQTCNTALCDAEVEHEAKEQVLFDIIFPFTEGDGGLSVSTVRPEVIFGDAAVAIHPDDKRYKSLVGKSVFIPLTKKQIPIIADECVDPKFGTGVLQITPAHSHNDFDIALKHKLPIEKTELPDRDETVKRLMGAGLISGQKKHISNIGMCYRCHKPVEPTLSKQWFIKMDALAKPAIEAITSGKLKITPKPMEKIYLHWLRNIKDWCISRQLTSGHKIPIDGVDDVLDTWYSSGLWPLATLGYPEKNPEFDYFYPNQVMIMGYEILFFWAIRMVFLGEELTGTLPFENLIFHGIVRDSQGRKMSKSLGNGIDPLDVIGEYGADALRFSLIAGTKIQRDQRFNMDKVVLARNFINKIWNATKLVVSSELSAVSKISVEKLSVADKWILTKLNTVIKSATRKFEKYDFGTAATELQTFFWSDFCDWYLEASKLSENRENTSTVLMHVLVTFLKLLNPIMPFITEEIFCNVLKLGKSLLNESFPVEDKKYNFAKERKEFDQTIELITWLRSVGKGKDIINPLMTGAMPKSQREELQAQKIQAQIQSLQTEIARGEKMLSNPGFVAKAKPEMVKLEREKLATNKKLLAELGGL